MKTRISRAGWAIATFGVAVGLVACDINETLLEPQNPGLIDETAVGSPAAALQLKVGAIGRLKQLVNCGGGECLWEESGHLADEFKNSDFQPTRQDVDQRTMTSSNTTLSYNTATTIRGYLRDALTAMQKYNPDSTTARGELYLGLGFAEMSLADTYCNGIPLGEIVNGVVDYSNPSFTPLPTQQVYDRALVHVDSALSLIGSATDTVSAHVRRAARVVKARLLVNKGRFADAAALVPTSLVQSAFQYMWTTSTASTADDLGIWTVNNSVARITVSDSFDIANGRVNIIGNAIPFVSAKDPRVPVILAPTPAEDGVTPLYIQQIWRNRDDSIPMASGIDARMIEAEAKLQANDIAGLMTILNSLRATPPRIGNYQPTAMAALPTPTSQDAAVSLFFREKAFWTFGRGQRLPDMRRMIRQYNRTEDKVFPTGIYYKGGVYGHDVNFPVPDGELVNPQFKGCIDRKA
jgi:starch-binding outer membrane protein, SusD/RagB family